MFIIDIFSFDPIFFYCLNPRPGMRFAGFRNIRITISEGSRGNKLKGDTPRKRSSAVMIQDSLLKTELLVVDLDDDQTRSLTAGSLSPVTPHSHTEASSRNPQASGPQCLVCNTRCSPAHVHSAQELQNISRNCGKILALCLSLFF